MTTSFSYAKVWFVLSLVALAFLYGTGVGKWGWFPSTTLNQATDQARALKEYYFGALATKMEPKVYDRDGIRVARPNKVQPGLTLITSAWKSTGGVPELRLIDRGGKYFTGGRLTDKS